jgi:hypothetical protein
VDVEHLADFVVVEVGANAAVEQGYVFPWNIQADGM